MATATTTPDTPSQNDSYTAQQFVDDLKKGYSAAWKWTLFTGSVTLVGGFAALLYPVIETAAVTGLIIGTLAVVGVMNLVGTFYVDKPHKLESFLIGTMQVLLAAVMAVYPGVSIVSLTAIVAAAFMVDGVLRISFALTTSGLPGWAWGLVGGVASVAASILIVFSMPHSSTWVLGTLVGINLIFQGTARIGLGLSARRVEKETEVAVETTAS